MCIRDRITWGVFLFLTLFAVKTFERALPDEIYVPFGEKADYRFGVPVSVTLKDDSEEVFYRLNGQEDAMAEAPFYTVTCKLFGIFPVKDVKVMMVDRQEVTAGGEAIGIYVKTDGILVLGTAKIADAWGNECSPAQKMCIRDSTYSLVHDDLPAMDNDEYRRGKKTTHAVYGEAMGILAGDALLNYAYETAARAFAMEPGNPGVCQAFQILTAKAGIYGMVGGQTVDVESEGKPDMTKEKLDFIYRLKTSALIEGAMLVGAVLAGATQGEQKIIEQTAGEVGLAFQIQDDILDVTSTMEMCIRDRFSG